MNGFLLMTSSRVPSPARSAAFRETGQLCRLLHDPLVHGNSGPRIVLFDIIENAGPVFNSQPGPLDLSRLGRLKLTSSRGPLFFKASLDLGFRDCRPRVFKGFLDLDPKPGVVNCWVHGQTGGQASFMSNTGQYSGSTSEKGRHSKTEQDSLGQGNSTKLHALSAEPAFSALMSGNRPGENPFDLSKPCTPPRRRPCPGWPGRLNQKGLFPENRLFRAVCRKQPGQARHAHPPGESIPF